MINEEKIKKLAKIIKNLKYDPIKFDNPDLFPDLDDYIYPNYVFFMVAIDHRTGFDVDWKYRGSDLLFYLARRKQMQKRDFFTARNLLNIDTSQIIEIFSFQGIVVRNPDERAFLLRDCASKLLRDYEGDIMNLIKSSNFLVDEITEKLREFRAYEDPMKKKSYLFLKILKRSGFKIVGKIHFPIDNILVKVALNSGILEPEERILKKIVEGEVLNESEVLKLREETGKALEILSKEAEIDADVLDDVLWSYGRESSARTALDERVEKSALAEFIKFINQRNLRPIFPHSWYF